MLPVVGKLLTAGTAVRRGGGIRARRGLLEMGVGWQQILLVLEGETPCQRAELFNAEEDVVVWLVQ